MVTCRAHVVNACGCSSGAQYLWKGFAFNKYPSSVTAIWFNFLLTLYLWDILIFQDGFCPSPRATIHTSLCNKPLGLKRKGIQPSMTFHFISSARSLDTQSSYLTLTEPFQLIKGLRFPHKPTEKLRALRALLSSVVCQVRTVCNSFLSSSRNSPALFKSNIALSCGPRLKALPLTSSTHTEMFLYQWQFEKRLNKDKDGFWKDYIPIVLICSQSLLQPVWNESHLLKVLWFFFVTPCLLPGCAKISWTHRFFTLIKGSGSHWSTLVCIS